MKKYIISALCALMLLPVSLFAQNTAKGTVSDQNGVSIPGAMVLDTDNGKWAVTDLDGNFSIEGAKKGDVLEVSCMGYSNASVAFQGEAKLVIILEEESLELEETVVIGYGSVKKKDLTGSVGVVNSASIEQQSVTQLSQSLQGAVPGLQVTRTSSMPGASATLQIRGTTSINGSDPLILVDGVQVGSIDYISTNDVESITVLKDAASASIYGARAAAGVILITTKSAKEGELHINYNGEFSVIGATEWAEYLTDPINYMTMFNEYKWNDAGNGAGDEYQTYAKETIENYYALNAMDPIEYPNFNWYDEIVKDAAFRHKQSLSLTYGNKVVSTRVSGSYENTDALYEGRNFERINARVRNRININKYLSADVDFSFKHHVSNNTQSNPLNAARMYPSVYLGLYPDGRIAGGKSGSNTLGIIREGGYTRSQNDYLTGKIALTLKPVDGLDITASLAPTMTTTKSKDWSKVVPYYDAYDTDVILGYLSGHTTNSLTETRNDANSYTLQVTANYEKQFKNAHNLNLMAGYEEYYYYHESMSASSDEMELSDFAYLDLANANNLSVSGSSYENAYRSFFARAMYNYKSRYYIQANVRADGSSRFASGYKWGVFPSVSVGWVVSNENFMSNVESISYLKLRGSIGTLGNERVGNYPYQSTISFNNNVMFDSSGNVVSQMTAAQTGLAVNDISWETTWTYDVGLDMQFFKNRLALTADYYYKETVDMLLDIEIPTFTGYSSPTVNAGTMYTNGWEFKIDWHDKVGDFTYGVGFNISDATSIVGDIDGKISISDDKIVMEGVEYMSWYGYQSTGIYLSQDEIDNAPTQLISTISPGDLGYVDVSGVDGEPDGKISADYDRVVLGSSLPHYIYGGYLNFGWKGLSLSVLFNGVGKQLTMAAEYMVRPFAGQWLSPQAFLLNSDGTRNYWSVYNTDEQNAKAEYPRLSYTAAQNNNYVASDYWLMNGAYLRIKNINLSYTFPTKLLSKAKIQGLKVYFTVDDPFCFDHYLKGWDPEQTTSSYIARTFTFGVDLKF